MDFDGRFNCSNVVSVEMDRNSSGLLLFPNPAAGRVNLALETGHAGAASLTLFDLHGKQMKTQALSLVGGAFQAPVDLSGLPEGVYLLVVGAGRERWQERLVVLVRPH